VSAALKRRVLCLGRLVGEVFSVAADEAKTTPIYRAVEAQSGALAPVTMATAYVLLESMAADRDAMVEKVQAVQAETENVRHLYLTAAEAASVSARELVHALNARDDAERECAELREALDAARCRLQELEGSDRQRADDL
jgi:hypothetical protein